MAVHRDHIALPEGSDGPKTGQWFTTTHWSVIIDINQAGQSDSPQAAEALEKLCRSYWPPLYSYLRHKGYATHQAQDLVQGFFEHLLETNCLEGVAKDKGKFRSFLLATLNHFVAHERDREIAIKRGGGKAFVPLDEVVAEQAYGQDAASTVSPEKLYDRRWALTVLEQALARLEQEQAKSGRIQQFDLLKEFLTSEAREGDYDGVAARLGMTSNAVAVTVHRMKKRFRELVRLEIAQTVSSDAQLSEEMRDLFAALRR